MNILVVGNDTSEQMMIARALSKLSDIDVDWSISKEDAMRKSRNRYDLVLLDLNLPNGCGVQLVKDVAKAFKRTPIVIVTSLEDEKTAVECLCAGAVGYIKKSKIGALHRKLPRYLKAAQETAGDHTRTLKRAIRTELVDIGYAC